MKSKKQIIVISLSLIIIAIIARILTLNLLQKSDTEKQKEITSQQVHTSERKKSSKNETDDKDTKTSKIVSGSDEKEFINVTVKVFDESTRETVSDARVRLRPDGAYFSRLRSTGIIGAENYPPTETRLTDENGIALFTIKQSGDWHLAAISENAISGSVKVKLTKGESKTVELFVKKAPSAVIKVVCVDTHAPIPNAKLRFSSGTGGYNENLTFVQLSEKELKTGEDGILTIPVIPKGRYWITPTASGFFVKNWKQFAITDGENYITLEMETLGIVKGKVIDVEGRPVSGAAIGLESAVSGRRLYSPDFYYTADENKSREDGTFEISTSSSGSLIASATHENFALSKSEPFQLEVKGVVNGIIITMSKGGSISGQISDATEQPVSKAKVTYRLEPEAKSSIYHWESYTPSSRDIKSDEHGQYKIENLLPGKYTVEINSDMHLKASQSGVTVEKDSETSGVNFVLDSGLNIKGIVLNREGEPVEDADVRINNAGGMVMGNYIYRNLKSDADGSFTIGGLEDVEYQLSCGKAGFASESRKIKPDGTFQKFVLSKSGKITGIVVSESDNSPISDFTVKFIIPYDSQNQYNIGRQDWQQGKIFNNRADGSFEIDDVPVGKFDILVLADDYAGEKIEKIEAKPEETRDLGIIKLGKGAVLKVFVVSLQEGIPVEGAQVIVTPELTGGNYQYTSGDDGSPKITDENGICIIKNQSAGKKSIFVSKDNFVSKREYATLAEGVENEIIIKLSQGGTLIVHVVSEENYLPVKDAFIQPLMQNYASEEGWYAGTGNRTDENGDCILKGVPTDTKQINVNHSDYISATAQVDLKAGEETQITVPLSKGLSLKGIVLSKTDYSPIADAIITAYSTQYYYSNQGGEITTDSAGTFTIDKIKPGILSITVRHNDYSLLTEKVNVQAGMEPYTFYLTQGGSLLVRVLDKDGKPMMDQLVYVTSGMGGMNQQKRSDNNGECIFEKLPKGSVYVSVTRDGFTGRKSKQANIEEGERTELEFIFGDTFAVYGVVTKEGKPFEKCYINVSGSGKAGAFMTNMFGQAQTDSEGKYRIQGIENGEYNVNVYYTEGSTWQQVGKRKIIVNGADVEANFSVAVGSITGTVTDKENNPIANAQVSFNEINAGGDTESDVGSLYGDYYSRRMTDENGRYTIKNLGKGKYKLTAGKEGYASSSRIVEKDEDQTLEVDFKLDSPSVIRGKIETIDGEPLQWISLYYVDAKGQQSSSTPLNVNMNGEYEFKRLSDGEYEIVITAQGYAPQSKKITVSSGKEQTLDFKLEKGNKLQLNIKDFQDNPIDGATISFNSMNTIFASYLNTRSYSGAEHENKPGTVIVDNVPSHKYEIKVQSAGYKTKTVTVEVTNRDTKQEVVLEKE